ncbi:hypothetical protein MANES_05G118800v8 [Manihot esculenta]|uniref:Uncharacterized protein n=1 Tax=Manihot esculenta TaxID=3983 RepID=A0A2C9VVH2_MANES|nr:hypothetical protein MANES_05G118800v8 [Manihot esculenta]
MKILLSSLFRIIICLSLLFIFFHGWCFLFSNNGEDNIHVSLYQVQTLSNRRMLSTKFDFTPFLKKSHRIHHWHLPVHPHPAGTEIDPRYGAEKRLVPTGPNPLHH